MKRGPRGCRRSRLKPVDSAWHFTGLWSVAANAKATKNNCCGVGDVSGGLRCRGHCRDRPFGSPECLGQTPRGSQPRGVSFPLAAGGSQAAPILGLRSGLSVSLDRPLRRRHQQRLRQTCRARPFCAGERQCEHCWHGGAGRRASHLAVARYRVWAIEIGPIARRSHANRRAISRHPSRQQRTRWPGPRMPGAPWGAANSGNGKRKLRARVGANQPSL